MRKTILLLSTFLPGFAVTTVQPVTEVSAQQAKIVVRTDQPSCTHSITEVVTGATPEDNNTTLFSGAKVDTRAGSIVNGRDRTYVAGARTAAQGTDGLNHSRSLKQDTAYADSVVCGTDSAVLISFNTKVASIGDTFTEQPPYCPTAWGNWCWPSINWTDQTVQYTDPETGVVIKRVTSPNWWGQEREPVPPDAEIGGAGWVNPQQILNGASCDGTAPNCAQTSNTNKLFLGLDGTHYTNNYPYTGCQYSAGYSSCDTYDDVILLLRGLASSSAGAVVNVCLSYFDSGATCNSATQIITLGTALSTVGFPANGMGYSSGANQWNPVFDFGEWGGTPPLRNDFAATSGNSQSQQAQVLTSGTAVTLQTLGGSSAYFNVKWNNAYIYIQGSGCTDGGTDVCQISGHPADTQHLTLAHAPASACATACNYHSLASGFVIWKANTTGTITIGAQYSYAFGAGFSLLLEGDQDITNPIPVSVGFEADGVTPINPPIPGNLGFLQFLSNDNHSSAGGVLFLLIPSRGETRFLSPLITPGGVNSGDSSTDWNTGQLQFAASGWDNTSGLCIYGMGPVGSKWSIFRGCYDTTKNWKAYPHPAYACGLCIGTSRALPGQDPTTQGRWSDDPLIYTNVTKVSTGNDIMSQIVAHNTTFDATIWPGNPIIGQVVGGEMTIEGSQTQGASVTLNFFNLTTGNLSSWGDTFFSYPLRFGGFHTSEQSNASVGYFAPVLNYLFFGNSAITLGGPFQGTPYSVYVGGTPTTNTAMTSSSPMDNCSLYSIPSYLQTLGATGNMCAKIHMRNIVSHFPSAPELAKWPSPQNSSWSEPTVLAPGDEFALPNENDLVVSVTPVTDAGCGTDCLEVVLARGLPNDHPATTEPTGWTGIAGPTLAGCVGGYGCNPGAGYWIPANTSGAFSSSVILDPRAFGGHADGGAAPIQTDVTFVQSSIFGDPYTIRYNQPLTAQAGNFNTAFRVSSDGPFSGVAPVFTYQSYPSNQQTAAPSAIERSWFLDFHHTSPGAGLGYEVFSNADPETYSLRSGTSTVYQVTVPAGQLTLNEANYKLRGLHGYAGHWLLQDVSGPGCSISDSTPWQIGIALHAGECVAGSSPGSIYTSVPNVPAIQSNCIVNWLVENYPCGMFGAATSAGWLVQHDASHSYSVFESARRVTRGFTGYGYAYEFNTFIAEPTGTWSMFKCDWCNGLRSEILMAKMPAFSVTNSVPRNTFVNYPVEVPAGAAFAEAQFGYAENGAVPSFQCMPRADACDTSGNPYRFESLDSRTLQACSSGCTINIPVVAGRAVYYRIGRSNDGTTWIYGLPQVGLTP